MNKQVILILMMVLMLTTISAEFIGTFQLDEEMQITNYCQSGVCTYITLNSLEYPNGTIIYPNVNMTKNGQAYNYSFTPTIMGTHTITTCGDSIVDVCDKDNFFVNFNGEDNSIGTMIILLLFFSSLFIGYYYLNDNIDYDKWYNGILKKYENKNYVKLSFSAMGYHLIRNKAGNYYMLGFPVLLLITDMIMSYNINSLFTLAENIIFVYSLGIFYITFLFFGQAQELVIKLKDDIINMSWGIGG